MKTIVIASLAAAIMALQPAQSQDRATCESIVQLTYDAINQADASPVIPHLSPEFSIAGHSGEIAKMILPQLFKQLNAQVSDISQLSATQTADLILVYEANFSDMGRQSSSFTFDKNNQIKEMELLKMEVKSMNSLPQYDLNTSPSFNVPFRMVGKLMMVEAELDGVKRNFILDSGAPTLVLNSARQEKPKEGKRISASAAQGVGGSIGGMDIAAVSEFNFAGIKMSGQEVIAIDLEHLEEALETEFYGLIGYDVIQQYDVLFNYAEGSMTFINPKHTDKYLKKNYKNHSMQELPLEMSQHIPTISARVGNAVYKLGIDTGAEGNLLSAEYAEALRPNMLNVKTDTLMGANKEYILVSSGEIDSMMIGGQTFVNTSTSIGDMTHLNDGYDIKLDGLIGYEILSKQPTLISFINRKMVLII